MNNDAAPTRKNHKKTNKLDLINQSNNEFPNTCYSGLLEGEASLLPEQPPPMLRFGLDNSTPKSSTLPELRMKRVEKKASYQRRNIVEPHPHDVLCGRGASINNFIGNLRWRDLIKNKKQEYVQLHKLQRHILSESIVFAVRNLDPPGRFLQRDPVTGLWNDIGDQRANEKTAQALREGAPKLRKKIKAAPEAAKKAAAAAADTKKGGPKRDSPPPAKLPVDPPAKLPGKNVAAAEAQPVYVPSLDLPSLPGGSGQRPHAQMMEHPTRASMDPFAMAPANVPSGPPVATLQQPDASETFNPEDFFEPLPLEHGHVLPSSIAHSEVTSPLGPFPPGASLADAHMLSFQERLSSNGNNNNHGAFWNSDLEPNRFPPFRQNESIAGMTTSLGFHFLPTNYGANFPFSSSSLSSSAYHVGPSFLHLGGNSGTGHGDAVNPFLEEGDSLLSHAADLILKSGNDQSEDNNATGGPDNTKEDDHHHHHHHRS
ncbi:hypothetical protein SEMRO_367_G127850.1 [Seminavis robusta]|uniref:DUF6824 domain-containing protein n=1 Tax=Seminavis robusta TaxID=568900 RepID=A0A9N8DTV8_9STRA|nr:hypothetical protein SEMRO_367_G127850.1 [Seminavis robusta]|eukprot:Sro367_g127850.1 n/a (485) ;mRNA; r:66160-67701